MAIKVDYEEKTSITSSSCNYWILVELQLGAKPLDRDRDDAPDPHIVESKFITSSMHPTHLSLVGILNPLNLYNNANYTKIC